MDITGKVIKVGSPKEGKYSEFETKGDASVAPGVSRHGYEPGPELDCRGP